MEDMDEVRNSSGTIADFSGWNVDNKFGKIKLSSKERVLEPKEEPEGESKGFVNKTKQRAERMKELEEEQARLKAEELAEKEVKRQRPGTNDFNINVKSLAEVKEMAKSLLPKIHEIKQEDFPIACELAINFAMTFEAIWEQKLGGNNG